MNKTVKLELLDYLATKAGCIYMSDLHLPEHQYTLGHILRRMDINAYSIAQWNEAVQYITGQISHFDSAAQAADYLAGYNPAEQP